MKLEGKRVTYLKWDKFLQQVLQICADFRLAFFFFLRDLFNLQDQMW